MSRIGISSYRADRLDGMTNTTPVRDSAHRTLGRVQQGNAWSSPSRAKAAAFLSIRRLPYARVAKKSAQNKHSTIGWSTNPEEFLAPLVAKSGHILYGRHVIPAGQPFSRNMSVFCADSGGDGIVIASQLASRSVGERATASARTVRSTSVQKRRYFIDEQNLFSGLMLF